MPAQVEWRVVDSRQRIGPIMVGNLGAFDFLDRGFDVGGSQCGAYWNEILGGLRARTPFS